MLDALELRAPPSQGGLGEVSRAITQVFLVTHFTSGEPALVITVGTDPAPGRARLQDIRADTDRWEVYLRRKIDLFSKTSVYHTLFIWEEKTDAECIVLNT